MTKNQKKPDELIRAEKLIDESKLDEAGQLIKDFEEQEGHSLHEIVLSHLLKCELLLDRGLIEDVINFAERTYNESLGLGKSLLSVDSLIKMALAQVASSQLDKSLESIKKGEDLLKSLTRVLPTDYKQRKADLAYVKGWVYSQKSFDQAEKLFEFSLSLREELGLKKEIASTLAALAQTFSGKGEIDRALNYSERSMVFAEESGNKTAIGYCQNIKANIHIGKGDLSRGISLHEQSLTIFESLNNKFMTGRILRWLGASYAMKGELNRSIKFYEKSLEIFKEMNLKFLMALVFHGLSENYKMQGELDRALECVEQSLIL